MKRRLRTRWPVGSYARFKDKSLFREQLIASDIKNRDETPNYAELERRIGVLYRGGRGPSRQYLSRICSDDGPNTTSCQTAERLAMVVGAPPATYFEFCVRGVRQSSAQNKQQVA